MKEQLEITQIIIGAVTLLMIFSGAIGRLITKTHFKRMTTYFNQHKFCLEDNKYSIKTVKEGGKENKFVEFTLKTLNEDDDNSILRFVYHRISQMKFLLWALLVPINLLSTPTIIYFLFAKTTGKTILKHDFLTISLFTGIAVVIQAVLLIIVEKGRSEFDELKGIKTES